MYPGKYTAVYQLAGFNCYRTDANCPVYELIAEDPVLMNADSGVITNLKFTGLRRI
jgi:hypothetical protein